ncbi:MAG: 6-pyruvoyl trahydropterin synthase family protein [Phycisphaerales bacterium]
MVRLTRTVRFAVNPATPAEGAGNGPVVPNGYAGVPAMRGLGRHYELDVACLGCVDPRTGYFLNIKDIDAATRATAIPMIAHACHASPQADPAAVLSSCWGPLSAALGASLVSIRWRLSPTYSVEVTAPPHAVPAVALLRQRFEFAASHRLHAAGMTDEENRRCFGKCNHPSGHGHNYVIEPSVAVPLGAATMDLGQLESLVIRHVIDRFDHKNLNTDTAEFGTATGLNPSVENIAKVCFDLLSGPISAAAAGARLRSITVWETEKTSCTYPADA